MDEQLKLAHSLYEGRQRKACHVFEIHFQDQKPTFMLFGDDRTFFYQKMSRDYKSEGNEKSSLCLGKIFSPITTSHDPTCIKKFNNLLFVAY